MLLQKWFHIDSDPELESQVNDRISFKKFLGLSFDNPSPDHSTFSRFRKRLSKNAMDQINSAILRQFEQKGLNINEGVAIDARLVKSPAAPSAIKSSKNYAKNMIPLKGNWIKMAIPKSSAGIWNQTGPLKMTSLTMGLKNMLRLISTMALSSPRP